MNTESDLHWEMLDKEHDWDGYFGHFIRVQYGQLCMMECHFVMWHHVIGWELLSSFESGSDTCYWIWI